MSFGFAWQAGCCAILLLAGGSLCAQTPPTDNLPPQLAPGSVVTVTNSNRATRKDGLKYLEEELSRSLQFFSGRGALDGVLAPPPAPPPIMQTMAPARVSKEKDSRADSWDALSTSERQDPDPLDSALKRPDRSRTDRKRQGYEAYDRLNAARNGLANDGFRPNDSFGPPFTRSRNLNPESNEDKLPSAIREKEHTLREKLFGTDYKGESIFNPSESLNSLGGQVGTVLTDRDRARDDLQSGQDYLERYRQLLTSPVAAPGTLQTLSPNLQGLPTMQGSTPLAQSPGLAATDPYATSVGRDNSALSPSSLADVLNPGRVPDLESKVLNQWNPLYQAPAFTPAKPASFQAPPFMETPRRRF